MLFLVNDILDFAQSESNKIMLNLERFKLKDLLDQCVNILIFTAELKGITLKIDESSRYPMYFTSD
jgi:signal transduction histidine kinase